MSQYTPEVLRAMAEALERLRPGSPLASLFLTPPIERYKNVSANHRSPKNVAPRSKS
jgi:hypothetical protein